MKNIFTHSLLIALLINFSIAATTVYCQPVQIIPQPQNIQYQTDTLLLQNTFFIIKMVGDNKANFSNPIKQVLPAVKRIPIFCTLTTDSNEAYQLKISKNKIEITAGPHGTYYALQTIQSLVENQKSVTTCTITDAPAFAYRGMHLDVCRHFFSVLEVKKYIAFLARYKFNYFHFHLTEDQAWRIQIKKYPLLTTIGSKRAQTLVGRQTSAEGTENKYDATPTEGFYTQEQIKEIVAFAAAKNITVIPEIEMPGHSLAAIASYAWLGCTQQPQQVGQRWGVYPHVYCAGRDSTFVFLQNVLDEVMELFPGKYIHIGGDEVEKQNWKQCKACQLRMQQNNLKDENELQSYFVQRIEKYINSKGKQIIGWDEILEGGLAPNATVLSWRGEEGGVEAAKQNHNVIMAPGSHCYFDHSQHKLGNEPLNIGGNTPYTKVYQYNPIPAKLPSSQHAFVLGTQANLWTEYIATWPKLCYMALPRMQALAEVVWNNPQGKNFPEFQKRLGADLAFLDKTNTQYRMPEPLGWADTVTVSQKQQTIDLQPINQNFTISYQLPNQPIQQGNSITITGNKPLNITIFQKNKSNGTEAIPLKMIVVAK